jgi:predicted enzyme related to lactoylglutathione lyase
MRIKFAELPVFNQDRAKAFYMEHFDCQVAVDAPMGPDSWRWIELQFPGVETTLHFLQRPDENPSTGPVMVLVDDKVEDVVSRLKASGVKANDPKPAPWQPGVTIAEFWDSEGNRMVLSSR